MLISTIKIAEKDSVKAVLSYIKTNKRIKECGIKKKEEYELTLLVESQKDVIDVLDALIQHLKNCSS